MRLVAHSRALGASLRRLATILAPNPLFPITYLPSEIQLNVEMNLLGGVCVWN